MLAKLSQRERLMLAAGALVCIFTAVYLLAISPYQQAMAHLDAQIASRRRQLHQVRELQQQCQQQRRRMVALRGAGVASGGENFALFPFIENQVVTIVGRDNLTSMRPLARISHDGVEEEMLEVKIEKISLAQLVHLLRNIDAVSAPVRVKNLRLQTRYDNSALLDAALQVAVYHGRADG